MAGVGGGADIKFERLRMLCASDDSFTGNHDGLRNVAARQNIVPDSLRYLVAPVGGAPAISVGRFEEEPASLTPKPLFVRRIYDLCVLDICEQDVLGALRYAKRI